MPIIHCQKCRFDIEWPNSFTELDKADIARDARDSAIRAVYRLSDDRGLKHITAKALVFHLSRTPGQCQRCAKPLDAREGQCSNCGSASLDW
jgi:hypothetical protein